MDNIHWELIIKQNQNENQKSCEKNSYNIIKSVAN